jgi:RecA-family ATPase
MSGAKPFSYVRACDLPERASEHRMLVEDLWADSGVGIIGGVPKQGKTWVALDLAVSVSSGTPCLGRFAVPRPGPVLVYTAEDRDFAVRERLAGLCAVRGIALADLDVHVICEHALHLDRPAERARLRQTLLEVRPRAVILDPLVRVYGNVDENSAAEVSPFLGA